MFSQDLEKYAAPRTWASAVSQKTLGHFTVGLTCLLSLYTLLYYHTSVVLRVASFKKADPFLGIEHTDWASGFVR